MNDYDVKSVKNDGPVGGMEHSHPSFGMVSVSRRHGYDSEALFGCEIKTNNVMALSIHSATCTQDLGRNWYFSTDVITEVIMSPVQYAEMISNPNTTGIPCTIRYSQKDGHIKSRSIDTVTQHVEGVIEEKISGLKKDVEAVSKAVEAILSQTGTLKKADKGSIRNLVNNLVNTINSAMPFYEESIMESIDKAKLEAKVEVESYVSHAINRAGIKALNNEEALKLIMKD